VKWAGNNVALFVAVQATYVALVTVVIRAPAEIGLTLLVVAALFTVPLLPLYLALVRALPRRWRRRTRRGAAIALSPLILTALILLAFAGGPGPAILGVALPGAIAYGAAVRLQ
jgi:hypothetical protein